MGLPEDGPKRALIAEFCKLRTARLNGVVAAVRARKRRGRNGEKQKALRMNKKKTPLYSLM